MKVLYAVRTTLGLLCIIFFMGAFSFVAITVFSTADGLDYYIEGYFKSAIISGLFGIGCLICLIIESALEFRNKKQ